MNKQPQYNRLEPTVSIFPHLPGTGLTENMSDNQASSTSDSRAPFTPDNQASFTSGNLASSADNPMFQPSCSPPIYYPATQTNIHKPCSSLVYPGKTEQTPGSSSTYPESDMARSHYHGVPNHADSMYINPGRGLAYPHQASPFIWPSTPPQHQIQTCKWIDPQCLPECKPCGKQFFTSREIIRHIDEDHVGQNDSSLYVCHWKDCHRNRLPFKAKYKLIFHIRSHLPDIATSKPLVPCMCGFGKHHFVDNRHEKPYVCNFPRCRKSYRYPSSLRKHMKRHRKMDKALQGA